MICFGFERKFLALYKKPVRSKVYLENRSRAVTHIPNELLRQTTIKSSSDVNRTRRVSTELRLMMNSPADTFSRSREHKQRSAVISQHRAAAAAASSGVFWRL